MRVAPPRLTVPEKPTWGVSVTFPEESILTSTFVGAANVLRTADVPQIALWDDHEVLDNWYPTKRLDSNPHYEVKSVALLAARAKRAFLEYLPLRPNPDGSDSCSSPVRASHTRVVAQ